MDAPRQEAAPATIRAAVFLCCFRVAALVAVAASSALYSQYLNPAEATFCGLGSGCEAVRRAAYVDLGSPFLSIPLVGILAYAALYGLSLVRPNGRALPLLAGIGAVIGVLLVATQAFAIGAFCSLCLVVDAASLACGLFAWLRARDPLEAGARDPLRLFAWSGLFVIALTAPFAWASAKPEAVVPDVIREVYVPGKVNVVEFADFECPYCRRLQPSLERVLEEQPPGRIHFVRGHVPLPSHPDAKPAARAAICAEEQNLEGPLAARLVELELTPSAIRRAAIEVGVDPSRFDACLTSKRPDQRIEADTKRLKSAGMRGLPTTYVGGARLLGAVSEASIRDAIERAARGEDGPGGIPGSIFVALLVALLALVAWLGTMPHVTLAHEPRD